MPPQPDELLADDELAEETGDVGCAARESDRRGPQLLVGIVTRDQLVVGLATEEEGLARPEHVGRQTTPTQADPQHPVAYLTRGVASPPATICLPAVAQAVMPPSTLVTSKPC